MLNSARFHCRLGHHQAAAEADSKNCKGCSHPCEKRASAHHETSLVLGDERVRVNDVPAQGQKLLAALATAQAPRAKPQYPITSLWNVQLRGLLS